jgi:cobaltochelatase CobS
MENKNGMYDFGNNVLLPVAPDAGAMVPTMDPHYEFDCAAFKKAVLWLFGRVGNNFLLTGPTGCGKSSIIEQIAARLNREVHRVPCHAKMEWQELVGMTRLMPSGAMEFIHGPLPLAMKGGGILLLDEINFLSPTMVGAANTILDGGKLEIFETGEVIEAHPDFRIAATGNAVDGGDDSSNYRGIQRMNSALIQRFLIHRMGYLDNLSEAMILNRCVPGLHVWVIDKMIELANDVRGMFQRGEIGTVISTRILIRWAKLSIKGKNLKDTPLADMSNALSFALTDGIHPDESGAIHQQLKALVGEGSIPNIMPEILTTEEYNAISSSTETGELFLFVKPSGINGSTFWGFMKDMNPIGMIDKEFEFFGGLEKKSFSVDIRPKDYGVNKHQVMLSEGYVCVDNAGIPIRLNKDRTLCKQEIVNFIDAIRMVLTEPRQVGYVRKELVAQARKIVAFCYGDRDLIQPEDN